MWVRVQLLYFPGCPHVDQARAVLAEALAGLADKAVVHEVDVTAATTPAELRDWGSPTILIDGRDVAGGTPTGAGCRLYEGADNRGVPPLALIRDAVMGSR